MAGSELFRIIASTSRSVLSFSARLAGEWLTGFREATCGEVLRPAVSCLGAEEARRGPAALDRGAVRLDAVWGFSVLSWVLRGDMDTKTVGAMETLSAMLTTGALPFARRGRRCGRAFHMALMFL